jgi:hypothetical protein
VKRGGELKRYTPLTAGTPLPRSTIGRNQGPKMPAKRPKDTGPDKAAVIAVLERDEYACVKCGGAAHGQRGLDYSIHHRRLRAQGVDNRLPNLVTLCGDGVRGCHGWAHHNRALAEAEGLIVRSGFDLVQTPIFHHAYGQIFLHMSGSFGTRPEENS